MQAAFHIERAYRLLSAAYDIHDLNGAVYKNSLRLAMTALGEAVMSLESHSNQREVSNG